MTEKFNGKYLAPEVEVIALRSIMKKPLVLAAVAALFLLASCQKENSVPTVGTQAPDELVFTATIAAPATKTTIDTDASSLTRGKVSWEEDDEITISDDTNSAVYSVSSISGSSATFTKKSGPGLATEGVTYTATYGQAPAASQVYSATAGDLPMSATSTTSALQFSVTCGLLKLTLTKAGKSIKSIAVSDGTDTYTLTCDTAVSIASGADFFIALPAGTYTAITFTDANGSVCVREGSTGVTIETNKIQPLSFASSLHFAVQGALPGLFSVADGKQVVFSKGNLYWDGSAFRFEENQYSSATSWDASHVSHFFWSDTPSVAYAESYNDETLSVTKALFTNGPSDANAGIANPGFTVNDQTGLWRALMSTGNDVNNEWYYLLNKRSASTVSGTENAHFAKATVAGVAGLIVLPDSYTHPSDVTALGGINAQDAAFLVNEYDAAAWTKMEEAGAVFLPVGDREGTRIVDLTDASSPGGYYWSPLSNYTKSQACCMYFFSEQVITTSPQSRSYGFSIRLVADVG